MDYSFRNDSPVYLQLASILEGAIVRGEFAPGDKLPSVREIALESRTNINTVQKALARLESQGLIETRRTSGKYVCDNPETLAGQKRSRKTLCETFLRGMQALGFSASESIRLLKEGVNDGTERSSSQ
ncbi:GntR family transcriptional regulator [Allobaculum sp. Allo2]|uniref:GntR family transcriptional regulator n=1 Tax=Allobaculum sp. Allo2 TaxID=2853432 RepID=UPI001F60C97E|nr:GntR family transcriptional regulator [Allobaculum sp. Allo2]UNT93003.1 GntR family transcriptional regulator [Allobaculum sp. Allo2]